MVVPGGLSILNYGAAQVVWRTAGCCEMCHLCSQKKNHVLLTASTTTNTSQVISDTTGHIYVKFINNIPQKTKFTSQSMKSLDFNDFSFHTVDTSFSKDHFHV